MPKGSTLEKKEIERIFLGFAIQAEKQITYNLKKPKKKVIILAGPTCSGKTRCSIDLAKMIDGEIISADSMQVYRGMDIGTAKATFNQRQEVPHHLIDIKNITEPYNVVDFYYDARHCCQEILSRRRIPIVVGGSGFYLHSLLYGPPAGPPSVPELRSALEKEIEEKGAEELYLRLKHLDPQYANTITKNDKQKIVRGLEIITLTGKKVSGHSWKNKKKIQNYDFRCWFLHRPKESLYRRIDLRCEEMVEAGLIREVEELIGQGLCQNNSAMQAIGYRQSLEYLNSPRTEKDYRKFLEDFKKNSRNYAKRQFTWFKKEPIFRWLDLDLHDHEVALEMIRQDYESSK